MYNGLEGIVISLKCVENSTFFTLEWFKIHSKVAITLCGYYGKKSKEIFETWNIIDVYCEFLV